MAQRYLQNPDSAVVANGDRRRDFDRRAKLDRRGTGNRSLDSIKPRGYGFRAFDERRSPQDRRLYEGRVEGERLTKPISVDAMVAEESFERPHSSVKTAEQPGEFRVLSVRRMGPRDGSPASPPTRGRIVDWEV